MVPWTDPNKMQHKRTCPINRTHNDNGNKYFVEQKEKTVYLTRYPYSSIVFSQSHGGDPVFVIPDRFLQLWIDGKGVGIHNEDMHSRKVVYDGINGDFFAMTYPSCHATIFTTTSADRSRAGTGARVIPMMGTETAVVKTTGWTLWWNWHSGISMTVSASERLFMWLGQRCFEIETGSVAFHTSSGSILHEFKSVFNVH